MKITVIAFLYLKPGGEAEFERFESAAAKIMARYGGSIERRIACTPSDSQPNEVHILTFPDEQSFGRYRNDAELQALSPIRARAIRQTVIWQGTDAPPFPGK